MGKLKRGIIVVFIANMINLSVSVIRNFVLPKYLSVESYADIKMYQLYISYAGFAALGYIDGMYLKYGGKNPETIDLIDFKLNRSTFRVFELVVSLLLLLLGIFRKDVIFIAMALSFFAMNMTDYYRCFYQAIGEFSTYSRIMNLSSLLTLILTLALLFIVKTDNSIVYIWGTVFVYYFVWILLEIRNRPSNVRFGSIFSYNELKFSISTGIALMLGTLVSSFMTSLDRWFVKFTLTTYDFALYSFAASTVGFLSYAISPISITLYNYFCVNKNEIQIKRIRDMILVFLAALISIVFPIKLIIEYYLPKYSKATIVVVVLFASQFVYGLTRCFYVNLYKAEKKQVAYFHSIILVTIMGVILNVLFFFVFKNAAAYAVATFSAGAIWLISCNREFKQYRLSMNGLLYSIVVCGTFISCGIVFRSFIGFGIYIAVFLAASLFFMKDAFLGIVSILRAHAKGIVRRLSRNTVKN